MKKTQTDKLDILFATDFSPSSRHALDLLTALQKAYQAEISFVHVITSFWKDWWSNDLYKKEAKQRLALWQQKALDKSEPKKLYVEEGNAGEMIIYKADQLATDLIVVGGRNIDNSGRYKTSTALESVARHADRSILIAKTPTVSSILCGIDGSEHSQKSLNQAIDLCKHFSAKLSIVYVLPSFEINPLGLEDTELAKREADFEKAEMNKIKKFLKQFNFNGIEVQELYPWGQPANLILDMAEDFGHDLIVLGATGHSLFQHLLLGSTAEKVLRHAPCSLWIVR